VPVPVESIGRIVERNVIRAQEAIEAGADALARAAGS
jgi:hypothetical protein